MKILLINPPYTRLKGLRDIYFPMGLGYIASSLEKAGHFVRIYNVENSPKGEAEENWDYVNRLDAFELYLKRLKNLNDPVWQEIKKIVQEFDPDVCGISCKTVTYNIALIIADIVKKLYPQIPIIFGGPHTSVQPEQVIKEPNIDFAVIGEGEKIIVDLINEINTNKKFENIPGIYFKKNGSIIKNNKQEYIENIDEIPFPGRHLLMNIHGYNKIIISKMVNSIFGSRGCPFKCAFCSVMNVWGRKVRFRSIDNIIAEIKQVKKNFGTIEFYFWDDTFTLRKKWVIEFCNRVINEKIGIAWGCHTKANLVTEDLIKLMKKAGCFNISLGVESGSETTLKYIKKEINLDDVRRASKILNKLNINWNAYFIVGFPEETEEEILQTWNFMKEIKPNRLFLSVFSPFPGTELYDKVEKLGLINESIDWNTVETKSPRNCFVTRIDKEKFKKIFHQMMEFVDNYNNQSDTFFSKIKIRLNFYSKHPILFIKRIYIYLNRILSR